MTLVSLWILANLVSVIPDQSVIPLSGQRQTVKVLIRNVSETDLMDVRLKVSGEYCQTSISPDSLERIRPSDRAEFSVAVHRTPQTEKKRFPVIFRITSKHHRQLTGFQLMADGRGNLGYDQGWIDIGTIKVGSQKSWVKQTVYILICMIPVLILLGVGWWLKKRSQKKTARSQTPPATH